MTKFLLFTAIKIGAMGRVRLRRQVLPIPAFPTACVIAQATNNNGGANPLYNSAGAGCASTSSVNVQVANSTETVGVTVKGH